MDELKVNGARIEAETRSIVDLLVGVKPPKKVLLFGSRGRGDARPDSDVDLCFIYDRLETRNVEVMEELYLSLFGHGFLPVDLLVYDEATFASRASRPHSFESIIEAEGVTVYG